MIKAAFIFSLALLISLLASLLPSNEAQAGIFSDNINPPELTDLRRFALAIEPHCTRVATTEKFFVKRVNALRKLQCKTNMLANAMNRISSLRKLDLELMRSHNLETSERYLERSQKQEQIAEKAQAIFALSQRIKRSEVTFEEARAQYFALDAHLEYERLDRNIQAMY